MGQIEREGRPQRAKEEGRRPSRRPQMGLAGPRRASDAIRQEAGHTGEALFLKSLVPALLILAP
jgi:hypothetical protein